MVLHDAIAEMPGTHAGDARVWIGEIGDRTVWLDATTYAPIDADVVDALERTPRGAASRSARRGFLAG